MNDRYLPVMSRYIKEGVSYFTNLSLSLKVFGLGAASALWLFLIWIRFRRKEKVNGTAAAALAALLLYLVYVFIITTIARKPGSVRRVNMELLHSCRAALSGHKSAVKMIFFNLVLLGPLGFLAPVVLEYRCGWKDILFLSLLLSASIECTQYLFRLGLMEADDLIHNCLGALIGYAVCLLMRAALFRFGKKTEAGE